MIIVGREALSKSSVVKFRLFEDETILYDDASKYMIGTIVDLGDFKDIDYIPKFRINFEVARMGENFTFNDVETGALYHCKESTLPWEYLLSGWFKQIDDKTAQGYFRMIKKGSVYLCEPLGPEDFDPSEIIKFPR